MSNLLDDLNAPQRKAVTHTDGPLLILAGAGSGKTRVITRRVAYLIEQGVAPWNILAITFTNKAAGEMRQRVEALRAPRGATLCTFHSLCARLLREFADEAGLSRNYSIYDQNDQVKLVKEAMTRLNLPTANLYEEAKATGQLEVRDWDHYDFSSPTMTGQMAKKDLDALLHRAYLKTYLSRHFLGSLFSRRTNLHRLRRTALRVFSSWIWFLLKERVASLLGGVFRRKLGRAGRDTKSPASRTPMCTPDAP